MIENRDESRDIAAHFRQNEPPHRQVVAVSWSVYRGTSYISQLERYAPHAQLVESERKLADATDERNELETVKRQLASAKAEIERLKNRIAEVAAFAHTSRQRKTEHVSADHFRSDIASIANTLEQLAR